MSERDLVKTIAWLRELSISPVAASWVPGASDNERRALAGLASVASHLSRGADPAWPSEIAHWLSNSMALPENVANEVESATEKEPDQALASLYADVVSGKNRRILGTFFTPSDEVDLMLERWSATEEAPDEVIDVGAGVGVFTAAAIELWPAAAVTAIDVNPITLGLLAARMRISTSNYAEDRLKLVLADFTTWLPAQNHETTKRRLILGNPPYTRWQLIPPTVRTRLAEETADLCGSRASLSAYMTAVSLQNLRSTDGLCLLLPAQWLESDYARGLRQRLSAMSNRRVELWLVKSGMFEDATVDAVVLLVGTHRSTEQPFTISEWRVGTPHEIDRSAAVADWRQWFEDANMEDASSGVPFREIATVRRGVATGANRYFVLTDSEVRSHHLPESCLRPAVQRLNNFTYTVDQDSFEALPEGEPKWLFSTGPRSYLNDAVREYIAHGVRMGFNNRHLCASRKTWHDLEHDIQVPDVIITAMTRGRFRVVTNTVGAVITNNLYGWKWNVQTPVHVRNKVVLWLRSDEGQAALNRIARRQGNALLKLEPRALGDLRIPHTLFG